MVDQHAKAGRGSTDGTMVFRDGRTVVIVDEGVDEDGAYLRTEHTCTRPGMLAGPHWHPALTESFLVREGTVRFRLDGEDITLGPGQSVTVGRRQVHQFSNVGERLVLAHEARPPMHHREMFELWHRLDQAGKTSGAGVPRNPLALGMLWELQDGYIAGIPAWLQRIVFGGLARLARFTGYDRRWRV